MEKITADMLLIFRGLFLECSKVTGKRAIFFQIPIKRLKWYPIFVQPLVCFKFAFTVFYAAMSN